jgi:Uma2 family endonuclease
MADPGPKKPRATYQDVVNAPEHALAEIIDGELFVSPRPGAPHTGVASALGYELGPPFHRGNGGPGGWILLFEPELRLGDDDILVPDLAGWRRERMAAVPQEAGITIAPDWVCEVLSRSTERIDRTKKLGVYAREGVRHVWLLHPAWRTLEVLRLHEDSGKWLSVATLAEDTTARVEPFDAIVLDLAALWRDLAPSPPRTPSSGSRASDVAGHYDYEYGYDDA